MQAGALAGAALLVAKGQIESESSSAANYERSEQPTEHNEANIFPTAEFVGWEAGLMVGGAVVCALAVNGVRRIHNALTS